MAIWGMTKADLNIPAPWGIWVWRTPETSKLVTYSVVAPFWGSVCLLRLGVPILFFRRDCAWLLTNDSNTEAPREPENTRMANNPWIELKPLHPSSIQKMQCIAMLMDQTTTKHFEPWREDLDFPIRTQHGLHEHPKTKKQCIKSLDSVSSILCMRSATCFRIWVWQKLRFLFQNPSEEKESPRQCPGPAARPRAQARSYFHLWRNPLRSDLQKMIKRCWK